METIDHFVDFEKYCKTCEYKDVNDVEGKEPCNTCLSYTTNVNSRKPVKYKEKEIKEENKKIKKEL